MIFIWVLLIAIFGGSEQILALTAGDWWAGLRAGEG
jgi:hypothetical protein